MIQGGDFVNVCIYFDILINYLKIKLIIGSLSHMYNIHELYLTILKAQLMNWF